MAQNQTLLESFKLPLTRSCPIPLNLGLVSFFLHLFDEDAIFGWAYGKLSLFHLVWIFYHFRFVTENPRGFFLFSSGITTWQHVQCASFMLFLPNAAFVSLAMFILHGCNITDNASAYLIFVIFFTRAKFLENKIYSEKTRKLRQNTQ